MARGLKPGRGEIWLADLPVPDKRRPVLILTRPLLIDMLNTVTVAAITSTLRDVPTEVALGTTEGLKHSSAVNLTNVFTLPKSRLVRYVSIVPPAKMREACRALALALACDD